MKMLILALVLLGVTGSLLAARLLGPEGGSGNTVPPTYAPTPTATPVATSQPLPQAALDPQEPQALTHRGSVLDRFLCADCHGPSGGWPPPSDHDSLGEDCIGCHAPAPEPLAIAVHITPGEAATQPLCSYCHSNLTGPVPPVVARAAECSSCHEDPERQVLPADHEGRSIVSCMVCHETRQLAVPEIPHPVEDRAECSFCHGNGRLVTPAGAHLSRGDDECLDCHESSLAPPEVPARMLHLSLENEGCTGCHSRDRLAPLPASHESRTEALCSVCHAPTHDSAPQIPHTPGRNAACVGCHDPAQLSGLSVKHASISESACTTCHVSRPGAVPAIPHDLEGRSDCTDCHSPSAGPPAPRQPPP